MKFFNKAKMTALASPTKRVLTLSIVAASDWETASLGKFADRYTAPPNGMLASRAATMARCDSMTAIDRRRIMLVAHREWAATRHRPGASFSRALKVAWAAERQRVYGPQPYQPLPHWTPPETRFVFEEAGRQLRAMLRARASPVYQRW